MKLLLKEAPRSRMLVGLKLELLVKKPSREYITPREAWQIYHSKVQYAEAEQVFMRRYLVQPRGIKWSPSSDSCIDFLEKTLRIAGQSYATWATHVQSKKIPPDVPVYLHAMNIAKDSQGRQKLVSKYKKCHFVKVHARSEEPAWAKKV